MHIRHQILKYLPLKKRKEGNSQLCYKTNCPRKYLSNIIYFSVKMMKNLRILTAHMHAHTRACAHTHTHTHSLSCMYCGDMYDKQLLAQTLQFDAGSDVCDALSAFTVQAALRARCNGPVEL